MGCQPADSEPYTPFDAEQEADAEEDVGQTSAALVQQLSGQSLTITDAGAMDRLTTSIASCSGSLIYAIRSDGTLHFNHDGGRGPWTKFAKGLPKGTTGSKIACDRRHLFFLDSSNVLWHASLATNGQMQEAGEPRKPKEWKTQSGSTGYGVPVGTTDIQSGNGNIYALAFDSATQSSKLWASELDDSSKGGSYFQGQLTSWKLLASNLGSVRATGAGSLALVTLAPYESMRPANRNVGMNPDGSLFFNDRLLQGQNAWTSFPNGGLDIVTITSSEPNVFYALTKEPTLNARQRRLQRFEFRETSCSDGVDNDANGLLDGEDPVCRQQLANDFCEANPSSTPKCFRFIQDVPGPSDALVTCQDGVATVQPGLCQDSFGDYLTHESNLYTPEPADMGRYCNVHFTDGTWAFGWNGLNPCAELKAQKPGGRTVRAGLYSKTQLNDILLKCSDGGVVFSLMGTAGLATASAAVGHTANACVVTVSPRSMPVFKSPLPPSAWASSPTLGGRSFGVGHVFDHARRCQPGDPECPCEPSDGVPESGDVGRACYMWLDDFGAPFPMPTTRLDYRGRAIDNEDYDEQNGYDFIVREGTPVRAIASGKVIEGGSRDRDVRGTGGGTPAQSEIYIRHFVGAGDTYSEGFVSYYAHLKLRLVVSGETVQAGQIIGYVGTTGASSHPHLHFDVTRITNTNGSLQGDPAFGHRIEYVLDVNDPTQTGVRGTSLAGTMDAYGWRAPQGIDPAGYLWSRAATPYGGVVGLGAWAPILWPASETPPRN